MRVLWLLSTLLLGVLAVQAQQVIMEICPGLGVQARGADFSGQGLILTAFDGESLWVYDIARATRYPLPETRPCASNCHLSPDFRWLAYVDPIQGGFARMQLDGTLRTQLVSDASDVLWWNADTLLVWTPDHRAWLRPQVDPQVGEELPFVGDVRSIQPAGQYALAIGYEQDLFYRYLRNLQSHEDSGVRLAPDTPYFNAAAWSPDGMALAYVGRGAVDSTAGIAGAELFLIQPGNAIPQQMTYFSAWSGAVRINGYALSDLSWSPDSRYLAFWVIPLSGADPETDTGMAAVHVLDAYTGQVRRYCDFTTKEHTPLTPRLHWSPDGGYLAFAGNVPGDDKGVLLLALELASGRFMELSDGIFPAWGTAQVYAWGHNP